MSYYRGFYSFYEALLLNKDIDGCFLWRIIQFEVAYESVETIEKMSENKSNVQVEKQTKRGVT